MLGSRDRRHVGRCIGNQNFSIEHRSQIIGEQFCMGRKHTIEQGEDLSSICRKYGLVAKKVEDHASNQGLWSETRDTEILHPGDQLELPDVETKAESVPTDARARFRAKFPGKVEIVLRLVDIDGPRANLGFELNGDGVSIEGTTDGDGQLKAEIPIATRSATVQIPETGEEYTLQIAHLNPPAMRSGAKQRLKNLGYYKGEINEDETPDFSSAVRRFQQNEELTDSGEYNDETRGKLADVHGC
jgi:hypothetical protein